MGNSSNSAQSKPSVTLKRTVAIKVIVTDKFKDYMRYELEHSVRDTQARLSALEAEFNALDSAADATIKSQMGHQIRQFQKTLESIPKQKESIDQLENGSEFVQGSIDGFVSVSVGDNLYEKLGGLEILLKDGVVQSIAPFRPNSGNQPHSATV